MTCRQLIGDKRGSTVPHRQERRASRLCWNLELCAFLPQREPSSLPRALHLLLTHSQDLAMTKDYFDPNALAATDSAAVFVNEVFADNVITTRSRLTSTLRTKYATKTPRDQAA